MFFLLGLLLIQAKIEHHMLNVGPGEVKLNNKSLPTRCSVLADVVVLLSTPPTARRKHLIGAVLSVSVAAEAPADAQAGRLRLQSVKRTNPLADTGDGEDGDGDVYDTYEATQSTAGVDPGGKSGGRVLTSVGNYLATNEHSMYKAGSGQEPHPDDEYEMPDDSNRARTGNTHASPLLPAVCCWSWFWAPHPAAFVKT